jgi:hypothetical protein
MMLVMMPLMMIGEWGKEAPQPHYVIKTTNGQKKVR